MTLSIISPPGAPASTLLKNPRPVAGSAATFSGFQFARTLTGQIRHERHAIGLSHASPTSDVDHFPTDRTV
eukprot:CAMPEP_0174869762 /NCGR_PEP_ID=MMETSP1114-20130205/68477_1 /TAXON_ID=312471 /ORGANISM="Neobodo designis, Strain CCAP 1951/1" /LENGTH=70 /DNA_ID=CAMNT_0016105015 /DNA_START=93 /DNA_END=301 /DNA_ORIENTATION=-